MDFPCNAFDIQLKEKGRRINWDTRGIQTQKPAARNIWRHATHSTSPFIFKWCCALSHATKVFHKYWEVKSLNCFALNNKVWCNNIWLCVKICLCPPPCLSMDVYMFFLSVVIYVKCIKCLLSVVSVFVFVCSLCVYDYEYEMTKRKMWKGISLSGQLIQLNN